MAGAPSRTLTVIGDQPIGTTSEGKPVFGTMWFVQFLQRLGGFVGQPAPSGSTAGQTLSNSVVILTNTTDSLTTAIDAATATADAAAVQSAAAFTEAELAVSQALASRIFQPSAPPPPQPMPIDKGTPIVTLLNGARIMDGYGSPVGAVVGSIGDMYLRKDGGAGTSLYIKESGTNTTGGWTAK